jgi:acyl CoA:acetate/3-ketoacid CoA transferase alpha subunit
MLTEPPNHPTVARACANQDSAWRNPSIRAIARFVCWGDSVALEGFTHLIPFAAGHEIIRQQLTELTLIRMTPDLIYDQMIGCGCARKLVLVGR